MSKTPSNRSAMQSGKTSASTVLALAAKKPAAKKPSQIREIDGDTWAASGGTAGIFGPGVRSGKIKIIED